MVPTSVHARDPTNPSIVAVSYEEWEQICSCSSSLHSVLHKTPQLDANERLDIVQTASIALGRVVARVSERLSDEMHGDGG